MMSLIVVGYGILFFGLGNEQLSPIGFFNFVCTIGVYGLLSLILLRLAKEGNYGRRLRM